MVDTHRDQFSAYDPSPNPEKACAQREKQRILREAICELRPTIRQAVEIQLRELSMEETAGMVGVSVAAAKGRLFHGRRALRKAFRLRTNQHGRTHSYVRRDGCGGCL